VEEGEEEEEEGEEEGEEDKEDVVMSYQYVWDR
jgi:hypothetical protein